MCVCVCVCGGGRVREGWGSGRCARARCVPSSRGVYRRGGGCLWPPHVVRGHSARRGEVEHHSRAKDNAVRVCMVGGGGWGVGGGGGECVVRGVCGRGANGLGVCAPVCVRCVGCARGCGGGGLAQRHS